MSIQSFRDLVAWQKAMGLVKEVYQCSRHWPKEEMYALTSQVRRAAVSVPANIAEGQGRQGKGEFLHALSMANGSVHEVQTHLLIARDLGYIDQATCERLLDQSAEVCRLLYGLMRSLRP